MTTVRAPGRAGHHRRRPRGEKAKLPAGPMLLSAVYVPCTSLRLTFDRAVDVSAATDMSGVFVDDGTTEHTVYQGDGPASLDSPTTVLIALASVEASSGSTVRLTAGPDTGIVAAAAGGAAWAGAWDVVLPFP